VLLVAAAWIGAPRHGTAQDAADEAAGTRQYAAAAALHNRELYELAATEWQKFVDSFPKHSRAAHGRHYLGICLYKTGQLDKAIAAFEKLLADHPRFELKEAAYLYLGVSQFDRAQSEQDPQRRAALLQKAADTFAAQLAEFPKGSLPAQAMYYRGECYYALGDRAKAAAAYAQLVSAFPNDPLVADALYALGVAQEEQQQWDAAEKTYATFLGRFAQHRLATEVTMRRGETLFARGQYPQAEALFAAAASVKDFRLADHATMRLAACLAARKQYAEAAKTYARVPQQFPQSDSVHLASLEGGKCAYLAGDYAQARALLTQATAAGGATALEAAHWIARSLLKENKPQESLAAAQAALSKAAGSPHQGDLMLDVADALFELPARQRESIAAYAALADGHPQHASAPQARYMAGFAALTVGDYQAALQHAEAFTKQYAQSELLPDVLYVAAESRLQLRQFDEAAQLYAQLLARFPNRNEIDAWRVRHALALHAQRKWADVVQALRTQVAALRSAEHRAEAQFLLGTSYNELRQFQPAAASLEAALTADKNFRQADEVLLALAYAYRQQGDIDKARDRLTALVQSYPQSAVLDRAYFRLAELAYDARQYAAAAENYQKVLDRWPQSPIVPHARFGLGWTRFQQGDYAAAESALSALLGQVGDSGLGPRAQFLRGLARKELKKFAEAAADLEAFLKAEPQAAERSDARYVLGLCQVGQKKLDDAVATFRQVLRDDPQYAGADKVLYEIGWALKELQRADEAQAAFSQLAQAHPNSPLAAESLLNVGEFHYTAKDYRKAAEQYYAAEQKARDLARTAALDAALANTLGEKAAHMLGWCYHQQDDFANAEKTFAYQLKTYPQGSLAGDAQFMQAEALFKQAKYVEALAAYGKVQRPSSPQFAALAALHAAQAAWQLQQYQKSLDLLRDFEQQHADSPLLPEVLYERGAALFGLGKLDEALPLLEEVTAKSKAEVAAKARFLIGEIYFAKKDHREAVRNFFLVAFGYGYPTWQANAHYEAARCFEVLGMKDQAIKSYRDVVQQFPESDKAPLARQRLQALGADGR
jgi:TolA-binding protein